MSEESVPKFLQGKSENGAPKILQERAESAVKQEPAVFLHNWLYSVVPAGSEIYLVGYCRGCNSAFTNHLEKDSTGNVMVLPLNIPKIGCAGP